MGSEFSEGVDISMCLVETLAAFIARAPFARGTNLEKVRNWLGVLPKWLAVTSPAFGTWLIRIAGPVAVLGDKDRAIAMLRQGIGVTRRACGELHPELPGAEASLHDLLSQ